MQDQSAPQDPQPRKRHRVRNAVLGTAGGLVLLTAVGIAVSGISHTGQAGPTPPTMFSPSVSAPARTPAATGCPQGMSPDANGVCNPGGKTPPSIMPVTPAPSQAPSTPSVTASQQQALEDAQGYLSDGQGFSRDGLIGQLQFDKFSAADATWAADNSGADWTAQAVTDAKGYMSDGQGFSRDGLISQLQFDKFTYSQAVYAAGQVGL
jgi:hypothetical protein